MTNPYTRVELSEEQWDEILGKYEYEELDKDAASIIWQKLKALECISSGSSLHVSDCVFEYNGVEYQCIWTHDQEETEPISISIQTPRRRISPVQLKLDF